MRKLHFMLVCCLCLFTTIAMAQANEVRGKITDSVGTPIQGASVTVKGGTLGTSTASDGSFKINVPKSGTLIISSVGLATTEVNVQGRNYLLVELNRTAQALDEVIVTALGIKRSKNQLPYAAQQVSGDDVNKTRNNNFAQNLSGKVSGLEIRQGNSLGASTNIVLRGSKSITGNNQALFVVDGIPFDNSNTNSSNQRTGRGGYDYGNAVADINPDDIESMTVLKGAAASALYGSRGANGVILITTKKGRRSGLGITINSGISTGAIMKNTFVEHQQTYGAGYGLYYEDASGFFLFRDPNNGFAPVSSTNPNGRLVTPTSEDASYGAAFDPNKLVYQWDAFDPTSPFFGKARPWVAAANPASAIFENPTSFNNSVFIDGGSEKGMFKLGYTRTDDKGIMPNSKITKNLVNFSSSYNLSPALTAGASINYSNINGLGRYGSGYDDKNLMGNMRQWWQTNVDVLEQKAAYNRSGRKNVTWNWVDPTDLTPIYWDNPYFTRYENFQNDTRNRYFGNVYATLKITDWLNATGRISVDSYDEIQEERQAKGSVTVSQYQRTNRTYRETNYDLFLNADKNITQDINLKGLVGLNIRKNHEESIYASTNGGLIVDRIYSLSNSANPINPPTEFDGRREVDGVFAGATFTWKDMITVDGTIRRDESSTLPKGNNVYYYPSVSTGFIFSKLLPSATWLTYGKVRANYAQVGNDAGYYNTLPTYAIISPFGNEPISSVQGTYNNVNLKPERTKSYEIGLEMSVLRGRAGFDMTYYHSTTFDQILPTTVSTATGYTSKFLNAGSIQNQGIELSAYGTPIKTNDWSWSVMLNWTRNRNKVVELFEGSDNLVLASFQGGVTINATLGQPYQTIRGRNFVYYSATPNAAGQNIKSSGTPDERIVMANGRYQLSTVSNEVIGNANPDWIGGINNTVRYKNVALSFLIDIRQGGDVFSLDQYYGQATGMYPETAGLNDLGNPLRNSNADGGGIIRQGVDATGKANTVRASANYYGAYGYRYSPAAGFVYDASYVKLREAAITYSVPQAKMAKLHPFKGIDFSLIGRNLWIIHKNLPYADPEDNISAGNLQGYQGGSYPTTRTFTFNVKLRF